MRETNHSKESIDAIAQDRYLKSSFHEKLVEHVFISEVLQEAWYRFRKTAEVLRAEVDASGYDVVLECNGILRHVQLKTSEAGADTERQLLNVALARKPGGCIVWIICYEDRHSCRIKLSYRFLGGDAGQPFPSLAGLKIAKHAKANAQGVKKERPAIRVVPTSRFTEISTTRELAGKLFGLREPADQKTLHQHEAATAENEDDDG